MRVLALDIGEKRVGVAMSDVSGSIASPLVVLDARVLSDVTQIAELAAEHEVGLVVIGLPLTMSGGEGPQSERVRAIGEELARQLPVPVVYHDERLSSVEAARAMRHAGTSSRKARGDIDKVAAALFLQSFLDGGGARTQECVDDGG